MLSSLTSLITFFLNNKKNHELLKIKCISTKCFKHIKVIKNTTIKNNNKESRHFQPFIGWLILVLIKIWKYLSTTPMYFCFSIHSAFCQRVNLFFHSSFLPQAVGLGQIEFEWLHPSTTLFAKWQIYKPFCAEMCCSNC